MLIEEKINTNMNQCNWVPHGLFSFSFQYTSTLPCFEFFFSPNLPKEFWALKVPPKVRTFVWRACSKILPTRENLHRRKVMVDPPCEICCQKPESVGHLLWECPLARNVHVWAICQGKIQKCPNDAREFFALSRLLVDRLPEMELDRWVTISWALWNARNKYYFEHVQQHPKVILEGALGFLAEYQRLLAAMNNS